MSFFPNIKQYLSPSAFAQWHDQRNQFIKSYFEGVKFEGNSATRAGKTIHALIEGGFIKAKCRYGNAELELEHKVGDTDYMVMGRPDDFASETFGGALMFVDYKTSKNDDSWDEEKLAGDLKMKMTAWLVLQELRKRSNRSSNPQVVVGFIELFQTKWDGEAKEIVVDSEKESQLFEVTYQVSDLDRFTETILKTIADINAAYVKWGESTDEFVNDEDVAAYMELESQINELELRQSEIKARIGEQMQFGGKDTLATEFGTFYFKENKTYAYPPTLKINYLEMGLVLEDAEKIAAAVKAAKTTFETENEPESISRGLQFRAKRQKNGTGK